MKSAFFSIGNTIKVSSFKTTNGVEEIYLTVDTLEENTFDDELKSLHESYMSAVGKCGLSEDTLIFSRFYITDIANQKETLRKSDIFKILQNNMILKLFFNTARWRSQDRTDL